MAAPPLPPKGSPYLWTGEKNVEEHAKWRSNNHNVFSASSSHSQTIHFGLGPDNLQGSSGPPPLPPPRNAMTTWEQAQRYTTEIDELSLIPPPPGVEPFKTKEESDNLIELSTPNKNTSCRKTYIPSSISFNIFQTSNEEIQKQNQCFDGD